MKGTISGIAPYRFGASRVREPIEEVDIPRSGSEHFLLTNLRISVSLGVNGEPWPASLLSRAT